MERFLGKGFYRGMGGIAYRSIELFRIWELLPRM